MSGYKWKPIEDLPMDWPSLAKDELQSLAAIWVEQANNLAGSQSLRQFNERLVRSWAIETGILEGLYSIDRGITQVLIEKGIEASLLPHGSTDKPIEWVVAILHDQQNVLEGIFDFVSNRRDLSTSYIKQLHQELTRHQETVDAMDSQGSLVKLELKRGEWKQLPNNPTRHNMEETHEYCPPEHVAAEMDRMIAMHLEHCKKGVTPEVEAAFLHHRFTQIHPFQDGNGRVARGLGSLVLLKAHWFPLVIDRDNRVQYIEALEWADAGKLAPLIELFSRVLKQAFLKAVSISQEVLPQKTSLTQIIMSAGERLKQSRDDLEKQRAQVFATAGAVQEYTHSRFLQISEDLNSTIRTIDDEYYTNVSQTPPGGTLWYYKQVVDAARKLDYFANLRLYHHWERLMIHEKRQTKIVFSIHPIGRDFTGIMAVSAFIEFRDLDFDADDQANGLEFLTICSDVFQFSYAENADAVVGRYEQWFHEGVAAGLLQWRNQL
ncbi:MAG: Fic family protein [bacterium]